ncbi:hypothetical protein RUND412_009878 [Rhizina undulata]
MATPTVPRQSTESSHTLARVMSHGRGGAGNIGVDENGFKESEKDLKIPTLKSAVYTTGRGGTGNMALNDPEHPDRARAAQDVEEAPRPPSKTEFFGGRGGAGNIVNPLDAEQAAAHEEEERQRLAKNAPVDHSKIDYRGWADRGKDFLFGRKK